MRAMQAYRLVRAGELWQKTAHKHHHDET